MAFELSGRRRHAGPAGFSLTELLVVVAIILVLGSMAAAAVSSASGSQKRLRTAAVIAKIDGMIAAQYASYAGRRVDAASSTARGEVLRSIVWGDLPDSWTVVSSLSQKPASSLTDHQSAYVAIWNSIPAATRQAIAAANSSAECLFMIVMQGGLADCMNCQSLRIDVGDVDGDGLPEFIDGWGKPIGFVLQPSGLQLPAGSGTRFFSSVPPFDPVIVTTSPAKGGMIRPLIVSGGPDGSFGLEFDASPTPGSNESLDNVTNFDEEAKR